LLAFGVTVASIIKRVTPKDDPSGQSEPAGAAGRSYGSSLAKSARFVALARNPEQLATEIVLGVLALITEEVEKTDRQLL
jgi:hypothetical protein